MKIHFKKSEYKLLLDVIYIADWVINSREIEDNPETKPYKDLEQKILSFAKDYGFENLVNYDNNFEEFLPTKEFEEDPTVNDFIDKYDAVLKKKGFETVTMKMGDKGGSITADNGKYTVFLMGSEGSLSIGVSPKQEE